MACPVRLELTTYALEGVNILKFCPKCESTLPLSSFYVRRGVQTHSYCKPCVNKQTIERQRKLKLQAITYKGDKCQDCNREYHPSCYDFHHENPEEKDFSVGKHKQLKWGDKIQKELDKCILLCSNCHRVRHAKY